MITSKTTRTSIFLALFALTLAISPIVLAKAEPIQLIYEDFYIEPSRPEVIAESSYSLNSENDYIYGIPETDAVGRRSDSGTYYLEIWSTARVEIYFLDSSGFSSQYTEFISSWIPGARPTDYLDDGFFLCDGYLRVEDLSWSGSISPKMILISNETTLTGSYLFTEGITEIQYSPYHTVVNPGDHKTADTINIFNVNASVSVYVLDDDQYDSYELTENTPPSSLNNIAYESDATEIHLNFTAEKGLNYHIIIWHEEFHDGVSGTILYNYQIERGFIEYYWSFFLVILLVIGITLFIVFREKTLPPVVWTANKANEYVFKKPFQTIRKYFSEVREEAGDIMGKMRGVSEDEEIIEKIASSKSRKVVSLVSLIVPLSLHRFIVGKIGTAIVSLLVNVLAILIIFSGINQIGNEAIGVGIIFLVVGIILAMLYIIDIIATFTGCFTDKDEKTILNW